jgi:hypothetical protein
MKIKAPATARNKIMINGSIKLSKLCGQKKIIIKPPKCK